MPIPEFRRHFEALEDPRVERTKAHALIDIVMIAVCACICGAEGWEDMEDFGLEKEAWLREHLGLELANGIPSDDTFRRLFGRLDPVVFARCLGGWVASFRTAPVADGDPEVIAMDGKTARHSYDVATGQECMHLVTAWATENGLALGQAKVDEKSNEITALPGLLKLLDIAGCIVTTDAMGCQKSVAEQVVAQRGDYVLAVKGNHPSLHEDLKVVFAYVRKNEGYRKDPARRGCFDYHDSIDKDHGRIEIRRCWTAQGREIEWLWGKGEWTGLRSVCMVESERRIGDKVSIETRYFLSSLEGDAAKVARAVRLHWGIENGLHHVLDVSMGEDACGIWKDHGPENLATLRRFAVSLLRQERTSKRGVKARMKRSGWSNGYLEKVILGTAN